MRCSQGPRYAVVFLLFFHATSFSQSPGLVSSVLPCIFFLHSIPLCTLWVSGVSFITCQCLLAVSLILVPGCSSSDLDCQQRQNGFHAFSLLLGLSVQQWGVMIKRAGSGSFGPGLPKSGWGEVGDVGLVWRES